MRVCATQRGGGEGGMEGWREVGGVCKPGRGGRGGGQTTLAPGEAWMSVLTLSLYHFQVFRYTWNISYTLALPYTSTLLAPTLHESHKHNHKHKADHDLRLVYPAFAVPRYRARVVSYRSHKACMCARAASNIPHPEKHDLHGEDHTVRITAPLKDLHHVQIIIDHGYILPGRSRS